MGAAAASVAGSPAAANDAESDASVFATYEMMDVEHACRTALGAGISEVVTRPEAVSELSRALCDSRARYNERAADAIASAPARGACSFAAAPGQSDAAQKRPRRLSAAAVALSAGTAALQRVVDAAVYLRNKLLTKLSNEGTHWKGASPLVRVQKLLFYADALAIAESGSPLFPAPDARKDGPVYSGAQVQLNAMAANRKGVKVPLPYGVLDAATARILDDVFGALGGMSKDELVDLTHAEVPWSLAQLETPISGRLMEQWFRHSEGQRVIGLIHQWRTALIGAAAVGAAP